MPNYRIQLKQGSRTIVNHVEAKNVASVQQFFETLTTMQVSEILEVVYQNDTLPPPDDFAYYPLFKCFLREASTRKSVQLVLQNLKLSKGSDDVALLAKEFLSIDGSSVDSVYVGSLKPQRF